MLVRALVLAILAAGCHVAVPPAASDPSSCPPGHTVHVRDALHFGQTEPDGRPLPAGAWEAFLADTLTPAMPDGFTVIDARGQWRTASGRIVHEPSRIVIVLHPPSAAATERLQAIVDRYRDRFRQESVLWERSQACVRF